MNLQNVRTPLLCVTTYNDPLVTRLMVQHPMDAARHNKNIMCVTTQHGGHVGWVESAVEPWHIRLFFEYCRNF